MSIKVKEWLTTQEVALLMGVSDAYVRRLAFLGKIRSDAVGRTPLYKKKDVDDYIRDHPYLGQRRKKDLLAAEA